MLDQMKSMDEKILWRGRPQTFLFILGNPLNYILAIILATINSRVFQNFKRVGINEVQGFEIYEMPYEKIFSYFSLLAFVPVIVIFLMPIWRFLIVRKIEYMVTDVRVYLVSGLVGQDITSLEYREIKDLSVNVSPLQYLFHCGTVTLTPDTLVYFSGDNSKIRFGRKFLHVKDPYVLYHLIKQVSLDVTTDQEFPNAFRPDFNPGYRTKMKR